MRIHVLYISLLLLLVQSSWAQNDTVYIDSPGIVGGTWVPETRYIARWDVTVPYDSVLTILPGVKIELQNGYTFKVEGQLIANGNNNQRIEISPYDAYWDGMTFGTPSGQQNSRNSFLSYIDIDCGSFVENTEAIVIGKHNVDNINNLNITNASNAVRVTGFATVNEIEQCEFHNVKQAVIFQYCDFITDVSLQSCSFTNILERAVFISQNQAYLSNINITGCTFDNQTLSGNNSNSAVYISINEQLTSVSLESNTFHSFSRQAGSAACIFISDNILLDQAALIQNEISSCGGAVSSAPAAEYGGIYINRSQAINFTQNTFSNNTGINSGAGFLNGDIIGFTNNSFLDNRNNNTLLTANYGGALTIIAGERVDMEGDSFSGNYSRKSGGAMSIEPLYDDSPIDLIFNDISLLDNSSENEGGAALIMSELDTLSITNSDLINNFSLSGSGGCFSIITGHFNGFVLESNTIQDNFVSATSDGGFLYFRHNPAIVPVYGNFRMTGNEHVFTAHLDRNYSLIYSVVKSFPSAIIISDNQVTDCYPVNGHLYHFELLQDGPDPGEQDIVLEMQNNVFQNNKSRILFFENNFASVTGDFAENLVEGSSDAYGTFLNILCDRFYSVDFENEHYAGLISGNTAGGAVSIETINEIGAVKIDGCVSEDCFSVEGSGGHFSFISGANDPVADQSISILDSYFGNEGTAEKTGGNGGAFYYQTPGNLDSLIIRSSDFTDLSSAKSGGALYINSRELSKAEILGSTFTDNVAEDTAGAIFINAFNGNIPELTLASDNGNPTSFNACISNQEGGALCVTTQKEIGKVLIENIESQNCVAWNGNGGHIFLASYSSDASVKQDLAILNSSFSGSSDKISGGNGGAICYYSADGAVDSVLVSASTFTGLKAEGSGGAIYFKAKSLGKVQMTGSGFDQNNSLDARGGALYFETSSGNIEEISMSTLEGIKTTFTNCSAGNGGGAAYFTSAGEIGKIKISEIESKKCYSSDGDGGHFAFISSLNDPSPGQQLHIQGSLFDNLNMNNITGGNGGALYYNTPGLLDSLSLVNCQFLNLKAGGDAGAVCVYAGEIEFAGMHGSNFENNTSQETGGAVFLNATNGNVAKFYVLPYENVRTSFNACNAKYDGGALCLKSTGEIGEIAIDSLTIEKCFASEGNGGHAAFISLGADPALSQQISISDSYFSNLGLSSFTGENGGMIYYEAFSDVASAEIAASSFINARAVKDGGSICLKAARIDALNLGESLFHTSVSEVLSGGAVYVKTLNGLFNASLAANRFINCSSGSSGGAVFMEDGKYDNNTENIAFYRNTFRIVNPAGLPGNGGAVYAKGFNSVTFMADSVMNQSADEKGGFVYLEKVYRAAFDSVYTYNNTAAQGGVLYHKGDPETSFTQSTRMYNSSFLFNTAQITGGCFYITDVDSVEIGNDDRKNNFVANQSLSPVSNDDQVGGGVFYTGDVNNLSVKNNSFYVNTSQNYGGIGIINHVASSTHIADNSILSNQAGAGGAFFFNDSFGEGIIENNNFSFNTSGEQAGVLLFSPNAVNSIIVRDNTFFKNSTGKLGGAITSYRPVKLIRNLFRENHLVDLNPSLSHKGTTVYLSGDGNQALIKNCVFDQNYYEAYDSVASIYFDAPQAVFPDFNIANCSFFNFSDKHYSVYNNVAQGTVLIQNSIFTQRQNVSRDEAVVYFNDKVRSAYSDLIYSQIHDTINHNYDEYVYFNVGDYFFDSLQYPVDKGNPDPAFNDFHLPPAYPTLRNDLGVSGGPDNPDTSGVFIFEEPVNLPNNFDLVVTRDCFTFTFTCMGEFVETYEFFYWFLPDTIIKTSLPELTYTFSMELTGNHTITSLGHDINNADAYGFGQYNVNLDIIRIISLNVNDENDPISVPSVPFNLEIEALTEVENDTEYTWEWNVTESSGVVYNITTTETLSSVEILQMTNDQAFIKVSYTLSACGRVIDSVITINLQAGPQWGYPQITYFPVQGDIPDSTSFFTITFDKVMVKQDGSLLSDAEIDNVITFNSAPCQDIIFRKTVGYTTSTTVFTYEQLNQNTMQPDTLCNGEYRFDVNSAALFTQLYYLNPIADTVKAYSVCCNDIGEMGAGPQIVVYPNPFGDYLHIKLEKAASYRYEIRNLPGQLQKSGNFNGEKEVMLNLGSLSDGLYILYLYNSRNLEENYMKINKITH